MLVGLSLRGPLLNCRLRCDDQLTMTVTRSSVAERAESRRLAISEQESPFEIGELFFSITDRRGFITAGNEVFARVSRYDLGEMIGKPHNLIRHPDMPRCVFQLLWDFIKADRPIAAYVKNRASDGSYYWVMAVVTPAADSYVSVRLKPTSPLFETTKTLYAELRAIEISIEDGPHGRKEAMEASADALNRRLRELGFSDYEQFMKVALSREIAAREDAVGEHSPNRLRSGANGGFAEAIDVVEGVDETLDAFVTRIGEYEALSRGLAESSRYVVGLAEDIRLFSLNALLESSRLTSTDGAVLSAVASSMRDRSLSAAGAIDGVNERIDTVVEMLRDLAFQIAISVLQSEGALVYLHELNHAQASNKALEVLRPLHGCISRAVDPLLAGLEGFESELRTLRGLVTALTGEIKLMRWLQLNGRIEASRVNGIESFVELFDVIGRQISDADQHLTTFVEQINAANRRDAQAEQALHDQLADFDALLNSI